MYEVELKAHVSNKDAVITAMHTFATFCGNIEKKDIYYKNNKNISARIRTETIYDEAIPRSTILLTYKRKELRTQADGTAIEINDEKECTISDATALESLLTDCGFSVSHKKTKYVMQWQYDGALFELCEVPPLGNFMEIEILSPTNEAKTIAQLQQKLKTLLIKSGISCDNIENRYYSELLRDAKEAAHV